MAVDTPTEIVPVELASPMFIVDPELIVIPPEDEFPIFMKEVRLVPIFITPDVEVSVRLCAKELMVTDPVDGILSIPFTFSESAPTAQRDATGLVTFVPGAGAEKYVP